MNSRPPLPPLPTPHVPLGYTATFTAAQTTRLRQGLIPRAMEERWLVHEADGWLIFRNSGSRAAIFWLRLEPTPDGGSQVAESFVSREPRRFNDHDLERNRD